MIGGLVASRWLKNTKANKYITGEKFWAVSALNSLLSHEDVETVAGTILPQATDMEDTPCWVRNGNGHDLNGMEIESDLEIAVNMIKEGPPPNFPTKTLVIKCTAIMTVAKFSVAHTLREGNRIANALAKMGSEQEEKLITLLTTPDEVLDMLAAIWQEWL
ncbi:hypothetical protein RHMOL_Rhmol02G0091000 [Rhododendron molle]|uniref:Uncharacterized protein n=1 Tax=Rhododendron molle TaxID=49168 RepID=A0ACC0PPI5_RHOML|nr:hypothetical protein RHMOL_Rhmol02G0091000 [Rhododendron molle]